VSTRKTLGQTCHLGGKGDSGECDDELFCLGPSGGDGTCVARSTLGGACSQPFRGCAGNADCERGVCVTPRLGALGDTCDQRRCGEGLVCGNEYTCQPGAQPARDPGTLRAEGQTCWGYAAFSDCVDGLECRNETCMRACR
jgi:hypothetical protein